MCVYSCKFTKVSLLRLSLLRLSLLRLTFTKVKFTKVISVLEVHACESMDFLFCAVCIQMLQSLL